MALANFYEPSACAPLMAKPLKLQDIARAETNKWEQVARRITEQLNAMQQQNPQLWHQIMPCPANPNQTTTTTANAAPIYIA